MKQKYVKRAIALLLGIVMLFCLGACSGSDGNDADGGNVKETENSAPEQRTVEPGVLYLAVNVMYNDADSAYYGNEIGDIIRITENGQYTLTFDCSRHLSDKAKRAGIRGLNNLTSIYLKDYDVTEGLAGKSAIVSCDIMYDKIVVDGKEFTITQTEPKSAIKKSGILDTNDPFNSWDGSAVAETEAVNHVLNMTGVENPQVVEITFTLSNLVFE